jgi:serine/threonine-protein kinase
MGAPPPNVLANAALSHPPAARVIAGYAIVREVARGAFGAMHLAREPEHGHAVALKTIRLADASARDRFLREARACAKLDHPGIVDLRAFGEESGLGWIAMEWLPGFDLVRYTRPARLLPEPVALEVAARIAEALAHAHDQGVVHRDLKPANVRLNLSTSLVKITDFGCAWLADAERTRSGQIIGTPLYMAPEQLAGTRTEARSDLYALGVVLFQLLSGSVPFAEDSVGTLLRAIASETAPDLRERRPDCPPMLAEMVARLLAKRPQDRQSDGRRLALELRTIARRWGDRQTAALPMPEPRHNR